MVEYAPDPVAVERDLLAELAFSLRWQWRAGNRHAAGRQAFEQPFAT